VRVERFGNGAHVSLLLSQRSDLPDELELEVRAEPDSAPLELCILTATMGNKARARRLWLADGVASSRDLFTAFNPDGFSAPAVFPIGRLHRNAAGDVCAAITTDEDDPAKVDPWPGRPFWRYDGAKVTQYWRKPAGSFGPGLQAAVNGRATYWLSARSIPGGAAIENFELREPFRDAQRWIFGISRKTPEALGFPAPGRR
jgi:hypothetical protein